ncbi:hypothetical protein AB0M12_04205 [Nocardia vinacea]|uniref:hypothetical protein n=1 Tax=Nocardia vinacea TaxID=96468 RepID=UPI003417FA7C
MGLPNYVVDGPQGWNDEVGYGAGEVGKPAVVVTSSPPESVRLTDLDWTSVTTRLSDADSAACERAQAPSAQRGQHLDVVLVGGGGATDRHSPPGSSRCCRCTSRPSCWAPDTTAV